MKCSKTLDITAIFTLKFTLFGKFAVRFEGDIILKVDIINYSAWKELKDLILFTYDPYDKTTDDNHFKELEQIFKNKLSFNIHSILVK